MSIKMKLLKLSLRKKCRQEFREYAHHHKWNEFVSTKKKITIKKLWMILAWVKSLDLFVKSQLENAKTKTAKCMKCIIRTIIITKMGTLSRKWDLVKTWSRIQKTSTTSQESSNRMMQPSTLISIVSCVIRQLSLKNRSLGSSKNSAFTPS